MSRFKVFRSVVCAGLSALLCLVSASIYATTFYEDAFDPTQFVLSSGAGQQVADDFTLSSNETLGAIEWWGGIFPSDQGYTQTNSFVVRLFTDAGGTPSNTPLFEQTVAANILNTGVAGTNNNFRLPFSIYSYSAGIQPIALNAGTTYWISVIKPVDSNWVWQAASFSAGATVSLRSGNTGNWNLLSENTRNVMSFGLLAPVPEPSTYEMLLIGLGALCFVTRRRCRSGLANLRSDHALD